MLHYRLGVRGKWSLFAENVRMRNELLFDLANMHRSNSCFYAIICNDEIKYIGIYKSQAANKFSGKNIADLINQYSSECAENRIDIYLFNPQTTNHCESTEITEEYILKLIEENFYIYSTN